MFLCRQVVELTGENHAIRDGLAMSSFVSGIQVGSVYAMAGGADVFGMLAHVKSKYMSVSIGHFTSVC